MLSWFSFSAIMTERKDNIYGKTGEMMRSLTRREHLPAVLFRGDVIHA